MTASNLALYDDLPKPEEQINIDVNASPVEIVKSIQKLWKPYSDKLYQDITLANDETDAAYHEAAKLFKPHAKSFGNLDPKQLESIISEIGDRKTHSNSGLFLSALLNETDLQELDGAFNYYFLGYRLADGKTIIAREESDNFSLGMYAKGNIYNYGKTSFLARRAIGGVQINYGDMANFGYEASGGLQINLDLFSNRIAPGHVALHAKGGIQFNFSNKHDYLGIYSNGGLQVNFKEIPEMGNAANSGLIVNMGLVNMMGQNATGGIFVNFGGVNSFGIDAERGLFLDKNDASINTSTNLVLEQLHKKLLEIDFIKDLKRSELFDTVNSYDWKTLEDEVLELKKELEEILK